MVRWRREGTFLVKQEIGKGPKIENVFWEEKGKNLQGDRASLVIPGIGEKRRKQNIGL